MISANGTSRLGFLASPIGISADSNPPYANISSSSTRSQPVTVGSLGTTGGAMRPLAIHAIPTMPKTSSGTVFTMTVRLLSPAPDATLRMFTTASMPRRRRVIPAASQTLVGARERIPRGRS